MQSFDNHILMAILTAYFAISNDGENTWRLTSTEFTDFAHVEEDGKI
jgi:hypothetical protein